MNEKRSKQNEFSLKGNRGFALLPFIFVVVGISVGYVLYSSGLIRDMVKQKKRYQASVDTRSVLRSVVEYSVYAVQERWCINKDWSNDGTCGWNKTLGDNLNDFKPDGTKDLAHASPATGVTCRKLDIKMFNPLNLERFLINDAAMTEITDRANSRWNCNNTFPGMIQELPKIQMQKFHTQIKVEKNGWSFKYYMKVLDSFPEVSGANLTKNNVAPGESIFTIPAIERYPQKINDWAEINTQTPVYSILDSPYVKRCQIMIDLVIEQAKDVKVQGNERYLKFTVISTVPQAVLDEEHSKNSLACDYFNNARIAQTVGFFPRGLHEFTLIKANDFDLNALPHVGNTATPKLEFNGPVYVNGHMVLPSANTPVVFRDTVYLGNGGGLAQDRANNPYNPPSFGNLSDQFHNYSTISGLQGGVHFDYTTDLGFNFLFQSTNETTKSQDCMPLNQVKGMQQLTKNSNLYMTSPAVIGGTDDTFTLGLNDKNEFCGFRFSDEPLAGAPADASNWYVNVLTATDTHAALILVPSNLNDDAKRSAYLPELRLSFIPVINPTLKTNLGPLANWANFDRGATAYVNFGQTVGKLNPAPDVTVETNFDNWFNTAVDPNFNPYPPTSVSITFFAEAVNQFFAGHQEYDWRSTASPLLASVTTATDFLIAQAPTTL
ncbi:MAG: hypothetical protein WCG27_03385, partial [Pseudomonadota bacterium]